MVKCEEGMYGAFRWIIELEFGIFTIDIGVWRELLVVTTNSIWIWCDHWKSIVCVLAICLLGTGFVYWPSRDRVSISPRSYDNFVRSAQARLFVDFARCSLEFGSDLIGPS